VWDITHLALDRRYLLLRTEEEKDDVLTVIYVLFDCSTAEKTEFDSEAALFEAAQAAGFEGDLTLMTLRDYDALFWQEAPYG
jgi:hypothetical protein